MKVSIITFLIAITVQFIFAAPLFADTPFKNLAEIQQRLNFAPYYNQTPKKKIKVAVFDKGFTGYENEIGFSLPASTTYIAGPLQAPEDLKTEHGLRMAQVLNGLMTNAARAQQLEPELLLYNVFGFTNFKAAVEDVIAKKVDLVLYSEVWEYGGNFDGSGFFNSEVSKATEAGIIWVNAAGNFGQTTFNSAITTVEEEWVRLPNKNQALELVCPKNPNNKCQLRIVLSWNDFKNNAEEGSDKDLDLALTDDMLNILESSSLKQSDDSKEARPGYSKYPREIIVKQVPVGRYYLRVKNRSQNFDIYDRLRISVDTDFAVMPSATKDETLLNPADNKDVVTVGAADSERSSKSTSLGKPDILTESSLILMSKQEYRGSSNSAAIVAAGFALLKSLNPELTKNDLLTRTRKTPNTWNRPGLSLQALGFSYTGSGCFIEIKPELEAHLKTALERGGVFVQTTAGGRIMTPFDPINLDPSVRRTNANDLVLSTPYGIRVLPRNTTEKIAPNWIEVFQRPVEAGLCVPPQTSSKLFSL